MKLHIDFLSILTLLSRRSTILIARAKLVIEEERVTAVMPVGKPEGSCRCNREGAPHLKQSLPEGEPPPVNIKKVVKLLTDPHSHLLYDRHAWALKRLVQQYSSGFLVTDLPLVFKILQICTERSRFQNLYERSMIDLLKLLCIPYEKEKMSDDVVYQSVLCSLTSQLGFLMRTNKADIQIQICDTLMCMFSNVPPCYRGDERRITDTAFRRDIIEESRVAEKLVEALQLTRSTLKARVTALKVLVLFSYHSAELCDQMLNSLCAAYVCCTMLDPDPSGELLFRSVEVLWNLFEKGNKDIIIAQMKNVPCITKLRDAFIFQLNRGYSQPDLMLRNDIVVVITLLASMCPDAPFLETGLTNILIVLASFQEVNSHNALVRRLKILRSHEDFEFKRLLFNLMVVLSADPAVLPLLSHGRLVLAMFSFVTISMKLNKLQNWTDAQYEELQLHAMACLCTLCPLLLDDYLACRGATRLLLLLEGCANLKHVEKEDMTFHGDAAREHKRSRMKQCLRLMRSLVSTGNERVLRDFADQGAITVLIDVLRTAFLPSLECRDVMSIHIQTDILFILSCLCDGDPHRMELFGYDGVDATLKYLTVKAMQMQGTFGHHLLLIVAVDLVWTSIVNCPLTREYFLEKEGAFLLMDLLDECPRPMRNQILGCILDLCEHSKTHDHVLTWRGKESSSLPHVLCQLWRESESRMLIKRGPGGVLEDPNIPLMGQLQLHMGVVPQHYSNLSPAILDVAENLRANIYALLRIMDFDRLPGLSVDDHVTISIIEKYLDFKMGEVWREVMNELNAESVEPIHSDKEAMGIIAYIIKEDARHTMQTQNDIVSAVTKFQYAEEGHYYKSVLESTHQKEERLREFKDYVARTSKFSELKAARYKMELAINASRGETGCMKGSNFHNTEIPNLHITTVCGKYVRVADMEPKRKETPFKTLHPDDIVVDKSVNLFIKYLALS